jgi:hypothetical protein
LVGAPVDNETCAGCNRYLITNCIAAAGRIREWAIKSLQHSLLRYYYFRRYRFDFDFFMTVANNFPGILRFLTARLITGYGAPLRIWPTFALVDNAVHFNHITFFVRGTGKKDIGTFILGLFVSRIT